MSRLFTILAQFNTGLPEVKADASTINSIEPSLSSIWCDMRADYYYSAGVQYIISQGDPQQTAKAKNMIIYAFVGLLIVAMAFVIAAFVINGVTQP